MGARRERKCKHVVFLLAGLVLWLSSSAPCIAGWDLAYIARFYYPPGGRRISHQQVYLTDLHGRHRKQVTFGADEPLGVRWVDHNHLSWIKSVGNGCTTQILDLRTWKVKVCRNLSGLDVPNLTEMNCAKRDKARVWHIPGQSPGAHLQVDGSFNTHRRDGLETEGERVIAKREDKTYTFEFPGFLWNILPGRNKYHTWVISGSPGASCGSFEFLFDIDWRTGRTRRVADGVVDIDLDPKGRYFAALEGGRPITRYGKRRHLWTNRIYVGELATSRKWAIASGLVFGQSVALRIATKTPASRLP